MNSSKACPPAATPSSDALEALQRQNTELAAAVAARDAFISVAAHELRNPMTPMIGQIDLLLNGLRAGKYSPDQIEQWLKRIQRVMNHYVRRAETLLDVSRITSGKLRLKPTSCDLANVVREVAEAFAEAAQHAGSPIRVDVPANLLGTWDRLAVEQILDNLLSNAIKYGARGPVEISTELLGSQIRIQVRDYGPGISTSDRARIFGRFERAVGLGDRRSGFGVGLWVVGQLVEAMDGAITVDEARGGGSVFKVILPRHMKVTPP